MEGIEVVMLIIAIWVVSCVLFVTTIYVFGWKNDGISIYTFCAFIIVLSAVVYASTYYNLKKQSRKIALQTSTDILAYKKCEFSKSSNF